MQAATMRVAILTTHGVEEAELVEPLQALREAGVAVDVLSPEGGPVQMMQHDEKTTTMPSQGTIGGANPSEYGAVVLPGGTFNADQLRMVDEARRFVRDLDDQGKLIAAICHAPWLLVSAGLVDGRHLTSYHTLQDDIRNAGGVWSDEALVRDANWISSRNPGDLAVFNGALLESIRQGERAA